MRLQIDTDNLPAFRELRQDLAEHLDRAETPVQQDQRFPLAMDLVVKLEPVHRSVVACVLVHDSLPTILSMSWATSDRSSSN
jgi:hypothetical protein